MEREITRPSLLARLKDARDHGAWREFERRYHDLIRRYCRLRGLQITDADDVHQIVLLNLSRTLPAFRYQPDRGRFHSYLGRVVDNAIRRHLARRGGPAVLDGVPLETVGPASRSGGADRVWEQQWAAHHMRLAMRAIRDTFDPRSVAMFDRILGGDDVEQVARDFSVSTQAVHKVKQRIRRRLEERVALQVREEDDP